jgi:hypothetical protein
MSGSVRNFFKRWLGFIIAFFRLSWTLRSVDSFSLSQIDTSFRGSCREPASRFEKLRLLQSFSSIEHVWLETGTYMGFTTRGLSEVSKFVHTLEPSPLWFERSSLSLADLTNVTIYNLTSEEGFDSILHSLSDEQKVNFWLDGHFSEGDTYRGGNPSPIQSELAAISSAKNLSRFSIFVDDFRRFGIEPGYPEKNYLVHYCKQNKFTWTVERDIFIMTRDRLQS